MQCLADTSRCPSSQRSGHLVPLVSKPRDQPGSPKPGVFTQDQLFGPIHVVFNLPYLFLFPRL